MPSKTYSFLIQSDIMHAITKHNEIMPGKRMTLLDGTILCLVKSFQDKGQKFYMSNKEIGKLCASNESTVQRSINKLLSLDLLCAEKIYCGQQPRRYLTYNSWTLQDFISTQ